jgi:hypothetical protein
MVNVMECPIETPNASKAGRKSDLAHWEIRLINQFLGEMQAAGLSDGQRSRAEITEKKPSEVA